jgi:hypothetical protein
VRSQVPSSIVLGFALLLLGAVVASAQSETSESAAAQNMTDALQAQMAADPAIMDTISGLQSDPEFETVLDDPEILHALESGDTAALLNNPKLTTLLSNPKVQEITKQLTK